MCQCNVLALLCLFICDKNICTLILVVMLLLFGLDLLGLYDIICILYMVF